MSKKGRKVYSGQQKMEILKKHLVDKEQVSDLCDDYGVAPGMFYRWQKQLFEGGEAVFTGPRKQVEEPKNKRIAALEAKLSRKDEVISELMEEYIAVKKKNGDL